MFNVKVKCPYCGHEFHFFMFRFNATITCEKCKKKVYVETKTGMYMILFIIFFLLSDYIMEFLKINIPGMNSIVYFFILLGIVTISLMVLMFVMIKLFGFTSIYRIRDDLYYRQVVNKAVDRKNNKKKK